MWNKVRYFLATFKGREWSGPAWYSHEKDENGFPTDIRLEYWHPLHLGNASSTDWDGEELIKIYKPLRKEFPEIGKSWVQGNIHSHHSMGAFFSGTDNQQLEDGANENFYYSLVVSTKPDQEIAFAVSYPDQFGKIHIIEINNIEIEMDIQDDKSWKAQSKYIKKNAKDDVFSYRKSNLKGIKQETLFGGQIELPSIDDKYEEYADFQGYNGMGTMTAEQFEKYDALMLDYDRGRIKTKALRKQLKKIGVDEYGQPLSTQ